MHGLMDPAPWRVWHKAMATAAHWRAAMDALGLPSHARTRAGCHFGGQAQRVANARALVRGPDPLIADEPAAWLDPAARQAVIRVLCETTERRTLDYTAHDLGRARACAARIVALRDGRIVLDPPPATTDPAALDALCGAAA